MFTSLQIGAGAKIPVATAESSYPVMNADCRLSHWWQKPDVGVFFLARMKGVYFKSPSPGSVLAFSKTRLVSFSVILFHPPHQMPHEFSLNFYISHCSYCGVIFASEKAVGANNFPPCICTMEGMHWGNSHSVTLKTFMLCPFFLEFWLFYSDNMSVELVWNMQSNVFILVHIVFWGDLYAN